MKKQQVYALLLSAAMVSTMVPANVSAAEPVAVQADAEANTVAENTEDVAKDATRETEQNSATKNATSGTDKQAENVQKQDTTKKVSNAKPVINYGNILYTWEVNATKEMKPDVNTFIGKYAKPNWATCEGGDVSFTVKDGGYEYSNVDFTKPGTYKMNIYAKSDAGVYSDNIGITVKVVDKSAPTVEVPDSAIEFALTTKEVTEEELIKLAKDNCVISDNASGNITVAYRENQYPFDPSKEGTYNLMFQASDASGNMKKFTIKVKVVDKEAPVLDYDLISKEGGYSQVFEATKKELTSQDIVNSFTKSSWIKDNNEHETPHFVFDEWYNEHNGKPFDASKPGVYVLRFFSEDASNNKGEVVDIKVKVRDTTAPEVNVPETPVKFTLTNENLTDEQIVERVVDKNWIEDNASGDVKVEYVHEGSDFKPNKVGTWELLFKAIDAKGNETTFKVKVQVVDEHGPIINYDKISADGGYQQSMEATQDELSYQELANKFMKQEWVTDDSGEAVTFVCDEYWNENLSGNPFNGSVPGVYVLRFSVMDASGNQGNGVVDIQVTVKDTTAPVVDQKDKELTTDLRKDPMTEEEILQNFVKSEWVTDNADGDITFDYLEGKSDFDATKVGTYTLYFTASDASGNKSEAFPVTVKVVDRELPTINYDQIYADNGYGKTLEVNPEAMKYDDMVKEFTKENWAQDNSGDVKIVCDKYVFEKGITVDGVKYPGFDSTKIGNYALQFYAVDGSGNQSEQKFIVYVEVNDTTAPKISIDGAWERTHERGTEFTNPEATVTDNSGEKLTATMDRVTYAETKEGLKDSTDYSSEVDVNRIGWYKLRYVAKDSSGNAGYATLVVHVQDTIAPEGTVSYSTTDPTNKPVTATITASEPVTAEGWIQDTTNPNVLTKVYNENATEEVTITDVGGNTGKVSVEVNNIDKKAPILTVTMTPNGPTNQDVKVTIQSDEQVSIEADGWEKEDKDGKIWAKTFSENASETVTATDLAGNQKTVEVQIANIDKENPVCVSTSYSTTEPTNGDVTVTLNFNETVTIASEGWKANENATEWTKVFAENAEETVEASDIAGNKVSVPVKVENIDKNAPEVAVNYSVTDPTNQDVVVTLKSDEYIEILEGDGNWKRISDTELQKSFGKNVEYVVKVGDKAGNISKAEINIANIDKEVPEGRVEYSTTELTNKDVTATVTFDEAVMLNGKGWIAGDAEHKVWTKTFTENSEETVTAVDAAGNETEEILVKVENIDKVNPVITGVENGKVYTKKVTAKVTDENLAEVSVNGKACNYKDKIEFAQNGTYTLAATDKAGNKAEVRFEVKIPKTAGTVNGKTNGKMTAARTGDMNHGGWTVAGMMAAASAAIAALLKKRK